MYKLSAYNFFIPLRKNTELIYNSISNALIEAKMHQAEILKSLQGINSFDALKELFPDTLELLINDGILVSATADEKDVIKERFSKLRNDFDKSNRLFLTLCPTNACNLACVYCFEKDKRTEALKSDNSEDVLSYIESILSREGNTIDTVSVTWFGGEPLMNFEYIKRLTPQIIALCTQYNRKYIAGIITNGTLLTKEVISSFESLKIEEIQVSIDGSRDSHDKKRIYRNGSGSYDVILKNTAMLPEKMSVTIRIHCDSNVWKHIDKLLQDLETYGIWPQRSGNVKLNLANLTTAADVTEEEYFKLKHLFRVKQALHYNRWARANDRKQASISARYPEIMRPFCGTASSKDGCVVDDKGFASKCFEDVYCEQQIAFHLTNAEDKREISQKFVTYNKFEDDAACNTCNIMPICETNCIKQHLAKRVSCSEWKHLLPYHIKNYYIKSTSKKALEKQA